MVDFVVLFLIALCANFFSAIAGGGAGLLQFPLLIFMGLPFSVALATHKVASVALGFGAGIRHVKNREYELRFCLYILALGLPGVISGARLVLAIPEQPAQIILGVFTLALGLYSISKKSIGLHLNLKNRDLNGMLIGGLGVFAIGFLNGALSSGTGLFLTLLLVQWFGFDYKRAVAYTMILVGIIWNFSGALTLGLIGEIQWQWLPALIAGALLGGYLGAHIAINKGNRLIKYTFEFLTLITGLVLIVRALF